jgi:hypothetical protein
MGRETAVLAVVGGVVRSLVRIPRQTRSGRAALRGDLTQARDFCAKPEAGDAPSFHSNCSDCGLYVVCILLHACVGSYPARRRALLEGQPRLRPSYVARPRRQLI